MKLLRIAEGSPDGFWSGRNDDPHQPSSLTAAWRRCDCEDRLCSLMVMGCGLAAAGVTPGVTGFRALVRRVRSWSPAPAQPMIEPGRPPPTVLR